MDYDCEHHDITYITQSNKNIPWNSHFYERQITNVRIINIGRKVSKHSATGHGIFIQSKTPGKIQ